jgi:hypothetical protein
VFCETLAFFCWMKRWWIILFGFVYCFFLGNLRMLVTMLYNKYKMDCGVPCRYGISLGSDVIFYTRFRTFEVVVCKTKPNLAEN